MALVKCPECQNDISDTVKKCPHCGFKMKKVSKVKKTVLISIPIMLFLTGVIVLSFFCIKTKTSFTISRIDDILIRDNIIAPCINGRTFTSKDSFDDVAKFLNKNNIKWKEEQTYIRKARKIEVDDSLTHLNTSIWNNCSFIFDDETEKLVEIKVGTISYSTNEKIALNVLNTKLSSLPITYLNYDDRSIKMGGQKLWDDFEFNWIDNKKNKIRYSNLEVVAAVSVEYIFAESKTKY